MAYYNSSSRVLVWPDLVNAETRRTLELAPGQEVADVLRWVRPTEPGRHATLEPLPADFDNEFLKPVPPRKGAKGADAPPPATDEVAPEPVKE